MRNINKNFDKKTIGTANEEFDVFPILLNSRDTMTKLIMRYYFKHTHISKEWKLTHFMCYAYGSNLVTMYSYPV